MIVARKVSALQRLVEETVSHHLLNAYWLQQRGTGTSLDYDNASHATHSKYTRSDSSSYWELFFGAGCMDGREHCSSFVWRSEAWIMLPTVYDTNARRASSSLPRSLTYDPIARHITSLKTPDPTVTSRTSTTATRPSKALMAAFWKITG